MSFVIAYTTNSYAIMMSDGRCATASEIISENYKKIHKIGTKVLIGCTGNANYTRYIVSETQIRHNYGSAREVAVYIKNTLVNTGSLSAFPYQNGNFIICGYNHSGVIEVYGVSKDSCGVHFQESNAIQDGQARVSTAGNIDNGNAFAIKTMGSVSGTLIDKMSYVIKEVSKIDKTVNTNCQILKLGI